MAKQPKKNAAAQTMNQGSEREAVRRKEIAAEAANARWHPPESKKP